MVYLLLRRATYYIYLDVPGDYIFLDSFIGTEPERDRFVNQIAEWVKRQNYPFKAVIDVHESPR